MVRHILIKGLKETFLPFSLFISYVVDQVYKAATKTMRVVQYTPNCLLKRLSPPL